MKHLLTFGEFLNEAKSISDLSSRDEQPMIKGIAEIINRVKDPVNKREMVDASIEDFKREGINFDYEEFRDICNEELINEATDIKFDAKEFLSDLESKNIIDTGGYLSSTGNGARGKNKLFITSSKYQDYDDFNAIIKNTYKTVGSTSMSSDVYTNGKIHFFFYPTRGNGNYEIVIRRKNYKR
jgi:hypothetical protein